MTLASDAIDWMERSIPPSMMTKVTPVARMNSTAVSPARSMSARAARSSAATTPTSTTMSTASVASGSHFLKSSGCSALDSPVRIVGSDHVSDEVDLARLAPGLASVAMRYRRRRA